MAVTIQVSDAAALCQKRRACSSVSQKRPCANHKVEGYGSLSPRYTLFVWLFLIETILADRTRLYVKLHKVQVDVERFDERSIFCAGCNGLFHRNCPSDFEDIGSCSSNCGLFGTGKRRRCVPLTRVTAKCDMLDSQGSVSRQWTWDIDKVRTDKEWLTTDRRFQSDGFIRPLTPGSSITCTIMDGRNGVLAVDINSCRSTFDDLNSGSEIVCEGEYGAYSLLIRDFQWNDDDPWSGCSSDCRQTRNIRCSPTYRSSGSDYRGFCFQSTKPEDWRPCTTGQCTSTFGWVADWGECNVECGSGSQFARSTTCTSNDGNAVDDRFCENQSRPTSQSCFAGSCPPPPPMSSPSPSPSPSPVPLPSPSPVPSPSPSPSPVPSPSPSRSPVPSPTPSPSPMQSPSSSTMLSPGASTFGWLFIFSLMIGIQGIPPTHG